MYPGVKSEEKIRGRNLVQGTGAVCTKKQSSEMAQHLESMKRTEELRVYGEKVGWAVLQMWNLKCREVN